MDIIYIVTETYYPRSHFSYDINTYEVAHRDGETAFVRQSYGELLRVDTERKNVFSSYESAKEYHDDISSWQDGDAHEPCAWFFVIAIIGSVAFIWAVSAIMPQ